MGFRSQSGKGLSWRNRGEEKLERSYWDGNHLLQKCWINSQLARQSQRAARGCWVMAPTQWPLGCGSGSQLVSHTGKHPIRGHLSTKLEVRHPWGMALPWCQRHTVSTWSPQLIEFLQGRWVVCWRVQQSLQWLDRSTAWDPSLLIANQLSFLLYSTTDEKKWLTFQLVIFYIIQSKLQGVILVLPGEQRAS